MSELTTVEILMNAQINFNNVAKMNPALSSHPIYCMALEQLKNGISKLETKEKDSGN